MTPETIAKIRSHKCGNRKLATVSALARMNKILDGAGDDLGNAIEADTEIIAHVQELNQYLTAALTALNLNAVGGNGTIIEISEISGGSIPTSVWFGNIGIPTGQATDAQQEAFHTAELAFADAAGKLRARLALVVTTLSTLNDLGNSHQKPNKGGYVGDPAHKHGAA